jgi:hypothetical protein
MSRGNLHDAGFKVCPVSVRDMKPLYKLADWR